MGVQVEVDRRPEQEDEPGSTGGVGDLKQALLQDGGQALDVDIEVLLQRLTMLVWKTLLIDVQHGGNVDEAEVAACAALCFLLNAGREWHAKQLLDKHQCQWHPEAQLYFLSSHLKPVTQIEILLFI